MQFDDDDEDEFDDDQDFEEHVGKYMNRLGYAPPDKLVASDVVEELENGWDSDDGEASSEDMECEEDGEDVDKESSTTSPDDALFRPERQHKTMEEMIREFDPENPPTTGNLVEMQEWLENGAVLESVLKYQGVLDSARERRDFTSLPMVQRQISDWIPKLKKEYFAMQEDYLLRKPTIKTGRNVGPFLCTLPPEKLAVVVARQALLVCLMRTTGNITYTSLASSIGAAVEEEVFVHRTLYKRMLDKQQAKRQKNAEDGDIANSDDDGNLTESSDDSPDDTHSSEQTEGQEQQGIGAQWMYSASHLKEYLESVTKQGPKNSRTRLRFAVKKARDVIEKEGKWFDVDRVQLGAALIDALLQHATVKVGGETEKAFEYEQRWVSKFKRQGFVKINEKYARLITQEDLASFAAKITRYKPMVVPPKHWVSPSEGGYLGLKSELMRYHGCKVQQEVLENADLSLLLDGLNVMGDVPWKINKPILEVAWRCWSENIAIGDIPTQTDFEVPPKPEYPEQPEVRPEEGTPEYNARRAELRMYYDAMAKHQRFKQRNMDLFSLRCSALLQLDQAEKFKDFQDIYFPYNIDFRGRAYPVPPHLSNVGSDLCRGLLHFSKAKPLGPNGLFWLKVHLANLAGKDKDTFEGRVAFTEANMAKVRDSAENPLEGERWWTEFEDPFQGLATCMAIVAAVDSGDPEAYMCSLPVHMDGSCNGLQHYAALGRDPVGGKAVNLCAANEPQDVYAGVMEEVIRRVAEEAQRPLGFDTSDPNKLSDKQKKQWKNNKAAKLVDGLIDRGVVKRTVMTSVYGVTYIGARQQIQEKITEKLENAGQDIDELNHEIFNACGYVAKVTMEVMGDLFTGARGTMNWLTTCASLMVQHGHPVAWISPIGVPVIQPYRRKKDSIVVSVKQSITLVQQHDDNPIHKRRQVTAFPPNFVHSLDSAHMLLTALEMDRRGLSFSAVHDSYWTHACDIEEMNVVLRDIFVDLYSKPLLSEVKEYWEMRYPDVEFPDLPKTGDLDLAEVRKAPYFFQ